MDIYIKGALRVYPATLPEETKKHWEYSDFFYSKPLDYVRSFLHEHYEINMHSHSFYEINIVLSGTGRHYIEGMNCEACEGCVFVIPPNLKHGYWQQSGLNVHHMLIDGAFFQQYVHELQLLSGFSVLFEIEPHLRGRLQEDLFIVLDAEQLCEIRPILARLDSYDPSHYAGDTVLRNAELLVIIARLCKQVSHQLQQKGEKRTERYITEVLRTMEYIRTHCHEVMTVDALSRRVSLSRSTFQRAFRRICGQSVIAYVMLARLERGRMMLRSTNLTIAEIAQACGFYDASHFTRAYSTVFGVSPKIDRSATTC